MDRLKEAARGRWLQSDYEVVPTDGPELGAAGSGDDAGVEMLKQRNNGSSSSHDGGFGYPSKHELATLRRVSGKIPWAACTIAFVELCERFSYYGTTSVFVNFIQQPLPDGSVTGAGKSGQSGALNMGQRTSTAITTFGTFLAYIMPLFGAYVAEQFLGRFKTMQYAIRIELLGHIFIILAATSPIIVHPILSISFLTAGIIILSVGVGGFKSNISPLIAEQCSETVMQIKITSKGERVIMDPSVTISRVYLYFYLMGNVGALTGSLSMAYAEKYVGFWLSYLLSTLVLCACPIVMMTFHGSYRLTAPTGSSVGKAARLWKMALMNQWSWNPFQFRKNIKKPGFWTSVKPSRVYPKPAWMTFDDAWVDEVRRGFLACKVFLWYPLFYLAFGQMMNNLTSQAATMTLDGIPNDIMQNLNPLIIIFLIPLMDQIFYPFLRSINIHFTPIRRITCGFFLASLAMFSSTITQLYIYKLSPCGNQANTCKEVSPISVWVQVLPYGLIGFAEIMAAITALEYAFTKAPENMRSTVQAISLLSNAVSSVLAQAFVVLSEDPYLVWNYGIVGSLAFFGGCAFWLHNRKTDREEDELNMLSSSSRAAGASRMEEDVHGCGGGGYAVVRSSADIEMEIIR